MRRDAPDSEPAPLRRPARRGLGIWTACALFVVAAGCGGPGGDGGETRDASAAEGADRGGDAAEAPAGSAPGSVLQPMTFRSTEKIHSFGDLYLASQPPPVDLAQIKLLGVTTVLNLRKPDEVTEFDEKEIVESMDMRYINVPFREPSEMTEETLSEIRALLAGRRSGKMLVHCSSANRVGAVWLVHRVLDAGLDYEEALAEAKQVGLSKEGHEAAAREYIESILSDWTEAE